MQLLPSLLSGLTSVCATFPDPRKGRGGNIAIADFGVSALAMFFMQSASFLAYRRTLEKGQGAPIARCCSASAEFPPTITSVAFCTRRTPRCCSPASNAWKRCWPSRHAAGLRLAGRKDPDRLGWNGVFLPATRMPALPDAQAPTARSRAIIVCCRRRSWRPVIPRSCR